MNEAVSGIFNEIRSDTRSGASEITEKAAAFFITFVENFEGGTEKDFIKAVEAVGVEIIRAQPAMAPLFNLVNCVLLEVTGARDLESRRAAMIEKAHGIVRNVKEGWERIADFAAPFVRKGSTVLVHSYSATLYRAILALQDRGKAISITCTESRPLREGVTFARRLGKRGIPVRLIVDAAAFQLLRHVDLVFVGADSISQDGVINKIGTRGLAMAAHGQGNRFFVLAGTEKCLPMSTRIELEKELRPENEVVESDENLEVLNFYFDCTPLDLISGVVTEKGLWDVGEVRRYLESKKIHPALVDWQRKK
jgi:translation initiation factor 2B subunit (eIF-2B alpha/beta/delta family)